MIRAVFDANVLVSALLHPLGIPARLLKLCEDQAFDLFLSDTILDETQDVLLRSRITRRYAITQEKVSEFLTALNRLAAIVSVNQPPQVILADPKDDHIIATAVQASASVIVSGDRHLLNFSQFGDIRIITPAWFLADLLQPASEPEPSDSPGI